MYHLVLSGFENGIIQYVLFSTLFQSVLYFLDPSILLYEVCSFLMSFNIQLYDYMIIYLFCQ